MEFDIVSLSRLQFATVALYHFLFVPLTLGLSLIVAIMETVYVMTDRPVWRQMTKFWGTLFGINFVLGVATGLTMEFQFGMNWSYYSHYVGDVFGAPLAIEGLMAFFLEATFVGLFFFGWDRLSKVGHLATAWAVALGSNLSALWILIANGWMQNPVGAAFNPMTMRMEVTDFYQVLFNPVAQAKFVHTVSAGYVTASIFVLGVSAWYLLRNRHTALARRSMAVAASFGLLSSLSVVGYLANEHQKMKLAAIEGMWETEAAPAPFTAIGFPDQAARTTHHVLQIPGALGLIATRSLDTTLPGIKQLVDEAKGRIASGVLAYDALQAIRTARSVTAVAPAVRVRGERPQSRLCLPAPPLRGRPAHRQPRADRRGRLGPGAGGGAAVLVVPGDGGAGLLLHPAARDILRAVDTPAAGPPPLAALGGRARHPAAMDRRRTRLAGRRDRPPALGDRGGAADRAGGVQPRGGAGGAHPRGLRAVLQRAVRGRDGADAARHPQGATA